MELRRTPPLLQEQSMEFHDITWNSVELHGIPWNSMVTSWNSMDTPWNSVAFHRIPWYSMNTPRILHGHSMELHGGSMEFHGGISHGLFLPKYVENIF